MSAFTTTLGYIERADEIKVVNAEFKSVTTADLSITNNNPDSSFNVNSAFRYCNRAVNTSSGNGLVNFRSRGTIDTPTALVGNDVISTIFHLGYTGTGFQTCARTRVIATEPLTATQAGSKVVFRTTDNGTLNLTRKITIDDAVTIGEDAYTLPMTSPQAGQRLTDVNGDGALSWESPMAKSYAEKSILNNTTPTTSIAGVWTPITGAITNGLRSSDFTSSLMYTGQTTKILNVQVTVTWKCDSSNGFDECGLAIFVNGVIVDSSEQRSKLRINATFPINTTSSCLVSMNSNDQVDVRIQNVNDSDDIIVSFMNMVIS